jgi:3-mercaptopyruvate sulfurtransferase SseA
LEDWISAGGPVETHPISYNIWAKDVMKTDFYSNLVTQLAQDGQVDKLERILDQSDVMQYLSTKNDKEDSLSVKLFDTRGVDNFAKGHIPGATSIPYKTLVEPDNALKLKPRDELQKILKSHNVDKATDTIWLSCGSGVSVCHLALALDECGYSQKPWIYDGSWNEWGSDPTSPKAVSLESEVTESSN